MYDDHDPETGCVLIAALTSVFLIAAIAAAITLGLGALVIVVIMYIAIMVILVTQWS